MSMVLDDTAEPATATGQYPGPVWADDTASASALSDDGADAEPPSATGQYPGAVWADDSGSETPTESAAGLAATVELDPRLKDAAYAEVLAGDIPAEAPLDLTGTATLDNEEIYRLVREVSLTDSGDDGYSAVAADPEFAAAGHGAENRRHFGLAFGLVLFTQESGRLGSVLRLMRDRDPVAFTAAFGADADALLAVTNAASPEDRLQAVGGEPLWSPAWLGRFRAAGALPTCQYAQNEEAIDRQFRPMLPAALALGLVTDRALAMAYDRVVTCGLGAALRWIVGAGACFRTEDQRRHALTTLGYDSVGAFQTAVGWVPQTGDFNVETAAALVAAARRHGAIPVPTTPELVTRLAAAATGAAAARLARLRDSTAFNDKPYRVA